MKKLLYYPSFEVKSNEWLKFAILYIDKLYSIIPSSAEKDLSDEYKKISGGEIDFFESFHPEGYIGEEASLDAIELLEKVMREPDIYSEYIGNQDYINYWRNPDNQEYTIFREKYSSAFEKYCVKKKLGRQNKKGIDVARTLGLIYMSLLTNVISEAKSISPITDYKDLHKISLLTRQGDKSIEKTINYAKGIIKLKVPKNLNEISLNKIIEFRKRTGFEERLQAFHTKFENYLDDFEQGKAKKGFFDSKKNVFQTFSDEVMSLGVDSGACFLGLVLLIHQSSTDFLPYAKEILAGTAFSVGAIIKLRNICNHVKKERHARKYLADLETLEIG